MSELNFLHVTDTHVLKQYKGSFLEVLDIPNFTPSDQLTKILQMAKQGMKNLDFILITGDLVHEGNVEDYRHLKEIIELNTEIPVYLALGNHDVTAAYWEAFHHKKECQDEVYYQQEIGGYRLIVLDSSYDKSGTGYVSNEQLIWLKDLLNVPSEKGSIVAIHHPIDLQHSFGNHSLKNSEEVYQCLQTEEVLAVFSGHIHQHLIDQLDPFMLSVAEGACFGVEMSNGMMNFTNNSGFNICTLKDGKLKVQVTRVPEMNKLLFSYDLNMITNP
ncbi:metallophosphoesterase family protein [Gracilibacillus sp. HCP3S3_G5_1]|uniref:metallophosphoesterase family protein n=1 Tax=unclassified Gracilibacillus TaxID=2625209 RepID=UPI003F8AD583